MHEPLRIPSPLVIQTSPYRTIDYRTVSYRTTVYYTMPYRHHTVRYLIILYHVVQYHNVPYRIMWYGTVTIYVGYLHHIGLLLRIRFVLSHLCVPNTSMRLYYACMMRQLYASPLTHYAGNTYASPLGIPHIEWLTH